MAIEIMEYTEYNENEIKKLYSDVGWYVYRSGYRWPA